MRPLPSPLEIDFDSSASIFEEKSWYGHAKTQFSFSFGGLYLRKYFIELHQTACQSIMGLRGPHHVAGIFCRNFWRTFQQHFQTLMKKLAIFWKWKSKFCKCCRNLCQKFRQKISATWWGPLRPLMLWHAVWCNSIKYSRRYSSSKMHKNVSLICIFRSKSIYTLRYWSKCHYNGIRTCHMTFFEIITTFIWSIGMCLDRNFCPGAPQSMKIWTFENGKTRYFLKMEI